MISSKTSDTDLDISKKAKILPIASIIGKCDLLEDEWEGYGKYKAKLDLSILERLKDKPNGKLILVTAMSPTVAGEGKTTVSIGLAQAMNRINKHTVLALREPSLGPVFGMKGGATGGGNSQVIPMEDINLHFTGDFHAITAANNLLAAIIDNHLHQGNELGIDPRNIVWKRALDVNDRALRNIIIGLGGKLNGIPREDGFDITVASEIMAVLCLCENIEDLKNMLGNILIAYTYSNDPVYVKHLHVEGALTVLLKDAIKPNLVQTLEHTPAIIHGGPFANIAHGCNSILATRMALKLGDYAVTEAGFGADLGAEKFVHIKCRRAELMPSVAVVVATIRALKLHGGIHQNELIKENPEAIIRGFRNLEKHVDTMRKFGLPVIIALNHFAVDMEEEIELLRKLCEEHNIPLSVAKIWEQGGAGGIDLAHKVAAMAEQSNASLRLLYSVDTSIEQKISIIAKEVYGADGVEFSSLAMKQMEQYESLGWERLPICMAKTQYSLSDNPKLVGRPEAFTIHVRELVPRLGAGFIVALTGNAMTMPGLPKKPAAVIMDVEKNGNMIGLS